LSDPPPPRRGASDANAPGEFRPERILAALAGNAVDYVAVGGIALIAHGVVRATVDVDIIPAHTPENLRRLAAAIRSLRGFPHGEHETPVTPELLARDANMRFETDAGQLDVLSAALYRRLYPELAARAISAEVDDVRLHLVSRNDLIRLKAATGRDRDLLDIGDLLALDE
jgi:predicted nucleotidyltransferase